MAGDSFAVLTISTDRFGPERIQAFFEDMKVTNLTVLQDRNSNACSRDMVSFSAVTRIALLPGTGHSCSQIPHPMQRLGST